MGSGASKTQSKTSPDPSSEKQEGRSESWDIQTANGPRPGQSVRPESQEQLVQGAQQSFQAMHGGQQPFQTMGGGQQPFQEIPGGQQSYQAMQRVQHPFPGMQRGQQPFQGMQGAQQSFQPMQGGQQPFQGIQGAQQPFQGMQGGQQPFQGMQGTQQLFQGMPGAQKSFQGMQGAQQPFQIMQGGQQPFSGIQRGHQSFQGMQGAQQPFQGMQGTQHPFQGMQGGQQPFQRMQGGQQSFQGMQGAQEPFQGMQGAQHPFQGMQGGQQPFQGMQGAQRPFQGMQGGQQPFQGMQEAQQSFHGMQGGQQPFSGMQGGQQSFQAMQKGLQPLQATQGAQPSFQAMQGGQQSFQEMQGLQQHPFQTMPEGHPPIQALQGGQQSFQAMQGGQLLFRSVQGGEGPVQAMQGEQDPFHSMQGEQQPYQTLQKGGEELHPKMQGVQQPCQAMEQGQAIQRGQEKKPIQGFHITGEPEETSQPVQSQKKIHLAVDPDVMKYICSSCHNVELRKLEKERQIKVNWSPGNNSATVEYNGERSDSWQTRCLEAVQSFLNMFGKCDLPVHKEIWKDVENQLQSICDSLSEDPPFLKCVKGQYTLRIVASRSNIEQHKKGLETKIAEMYKEATFKRETISNVSNSHLFLMKTTKFCERELREKCPEVVVAIDEKKLEIRLEGPKEQVQIAVQEIKYRHQTTAKKKMTIDPDVFKILDTKETKDAIVQALREQRIEAVTTFWSSQQSVEVLGSSNEHAERASEVVSGMVAKDKIIMKEKYLSLMETESWSAYCEKVVKKTKVNFCKHSSGDLWIIGLKSNVSSAIRKLQHYLDNNAESEEEFKCPSSDIKEYLLRFAKNDIEKYSVKVRNGDDNLTLYLSGRDEGLTKAADLIEELSKDVVVQNIKFKQPGLRKLYESGDFEGQLKKVEDQEKCFIRVEKIDYGTVGSVGATLTSNSATASVKVDSSSLVTLTGTGSLATSLGHNISWKPGDITKEQTEVQVIPQGGCFDRIKSSFNQATIQSVTQLNAGDIAVSQSSNLPCRHVIHSNCSFWDGSGNNGEKTLRAIVKKSLLEADKLGAKSIAFPVIGTGLWGFPLQEASRIMLDETINSCQKYQHPTVKDIRFVLYHQDKNLIKAFHQEAMKMQTQGTKTVERTGGMDLSEIVEVVSGDLTQETTDAIVNIIGTDMNMNNFGQLSRVIAKASGAQVQQECSQFGRQSPGSAVMTGGGTLAAPHIIHIVPGSGGKRDLQNCLEAGLRLADANNLQSISIPTIGTGGYRLSFIDSAQLTFQALLNTFGNFNSVSKVRIVVYQSQMVPIFQQEQQKYSPLPIKAVTSQSVVGSNISVEVISGDLTKERTDAIVNIIGTNMNMNTAGQLSKAISQASGPQVQQECNQLGTQTPGAALMTSGGNLEVPHIIHIVPGSPDRQHLQACLEGALRVADTNNLQSISIPAIGTGDYGLSADDSAQLTFHALRNISGNLKRISKVRIVLYQTQMVQTFQQEQQKCSLLANKGVLSQPVFESRIRVDVVKDDLTKENTDAIVNIIGCDMDMNNFGQLSKVIAQASGPQVQQECSQFGRQSPGSAVMTSGGNLAAPHIIHIVPGTGDKQNLQDSLEAGLRLADTNNLQSISIPTIGTGGYGLSAKDSANIVFQALENFSRSCINISIVRIVVFQDQVIQAFQEEKNSKGKLGASYKSSRFMKLTSQSSSLSVRVWVTGGSKNSVDKATAELKKIFSSACVTKKVDNEGISCLPQMQISQLQSEASKFDMELTIDNSLKCITVRGYPADMPDMVSKITDKITKAIKQEKQKQEDDNAQMISNLVEWSYTVRGKKKTFDKKTNAQLETAHNKKASTVQVFIEGQTFDVDLKAKTGCGQRSGEQITVTRTPKEGNQVMPLPDNWIRMGQERVLTVPLDPNSPEYQNVVSKLLATAGGVNIKKIERVQNPRLFRSYMTLKQEMDTTNFGKSERQLFHGTDGKNVSKINTQGLNRSLSGVHGTALGHGVYFARDASYSLGYTGGGGGNGYMYLARVLVGHYCQGRSGMLMPSPKDPIRPDILCDSVVDNPNNPTVFVVFNDNQFYLEYLINF